MDRGLLNRATAADAQPTPGYMYLEIAKMTYAPNGSHQLEDYLCNKITSKDDANVKFKCLRIIRNILDPDAQVQASMDFRKRIQRRADVVKSCRMYRGPVDPLRGDAPSKAVREEAEAALKMIFNEAAASVGSQESRQATVPYSGLHDRIKGFGSTTEGGPPPPNAWGGAPPPPQQQQPIPYPGGVYPGPPVSTGRMQGFGNPEFNDYNNTQPGDLNLDVTYEVEATPETIADYQEGAEALDSNPDVNQALETNMASNLDLAGVEVSSVTVESEPLVMVTTTTPAPSSDDSNTGAIIGGVIGGLVGLAIIGFVAMKVLKK
ncbi:conserved hypothetical protein [Perkinsus marinus ATCC 50983]|uniref:ENTH domain-containing protein n=1 Tax=Perkinsus marinus (strain ATCC 50983 / TXsc) TaxID=423536 RepID=C5L7N4_PERM5|nr:conserved hypothetical protein [Perkinsus marinus ATCC 50983]EER07496.1 conserved hypothetical protein [Perkinsus marinus ATCC 50983]|eukprot:XP_002775680.1 conserved hypothetical protein [Perkinsus marinus ATCC 50983]